jgi:outer membrane protein OmpA-like peptidoglycan-associated protein
MRPFFCGPAVRRLISVAALLAVLCFAVSAVADDCKRVPNILILFDASGYMREKNRYQNFLQQMELFQQGLPLTADGFFDVGVRHYGLKVGLGCQNTESILALQPWDPERFMNCFPKTVSYGVSSLAAGLRAAADDVAAATGKSVILVIGGGLESCKADPIKITQQICANNPDVAVHTFQMGSATEGTFLMRGISEVGRGVYTSLDEAPSPALWYAWMMKNLVMPCAASVRSPAEVLTPTFSPTTFDANAVSVRSKNPAMDAANMANLQAVGQFLRDTPTARLILHGFSAGKGSVKSHLKISRKRAEAVAQFLMSTYHLPSSQMSIVAHGAAEGTSGNTVVFEISR